MTQWLFIDREDTFTVAIENGQWMNKYNIKDKYRLQRIELEV